MKIGTKITKKRKSLTKGLWWRYYWKYSKIKNCLYYSLRKELFIKKLK